MQSGRAEPWFGPNLYTQNTQTLKMSDKENE
jgi:hypothetical protein